MDKVARLIERQNRNKARLELLALYRGKHVAWSLDMTSVLASNEDLGKLYDEMDRRGVSGEDYITEYVSGEAHI